MDATVIINGLTLAGVIWIAASITGLRERVARIEERLNIRQPKET